MAGGEAEPLAVVVRGGRVESVHLGHLVVLGPDGAVRLAVGDPATRIWPRSSLKPVQAVAMLRCGLAVDDPGLALACASHSGTPEHLAVVRGVLGAAGLDESDLQNTPGLPLNAQAALDWRVAGGGPAAVTHNCSGKHAAMLATCVAAGWEVATYREPEHPLQRAIRTTVAELTGDPVDDVTVDGCGAPLFAATVVGMAQALGRIAAAGACPGRTGADRVAVGGVDADRVAVGGVDAGAADRRGADPLARVARAMTAHPWLVGGPGRDVSRFMVAVPGLVAKDGAEGVYAAGLPDGSAVAMKVADGASRPRAAIMAAALEIALRADPGAGARRAGGRRAGSGLAGSGLAGDGDMPHDGTGDGVGLEGVAVEGGVVADGARDGVGQALREVGRTPVLGHGRPVGEVAAVLGRAVRDVTVGRPW